MSDPYASHELWWRSTKEGERQMDNIERLHWSLTLAMAEIRKTWQELNVPGQLYIGITVTGNIHDGDLLVEYSAGLSYQDTYVKGGDLAAVVGEYLRRRNFSDRHQARRLTGPKEEKPRTPLSSDVPIDF
jgi:hypothetical protein